jgi:hypothetical protein
MTLMFTVAVVTPTGTRFFGPFKTANQAAAYGSDMPNAWSILPMTGEPKPAQIRKRTSKRHARS